MLRTIATSCAFVALVLWLVCYILWSSLDFQQCIKSYRGNDPTTKDFEKGVPIFVVPIPTYRHCVGAYVVDKNPAITAVGTLIIAAFTTVLSIFTIGLARSTKIAAIAAKTAAEHIPTVEGANVYVLLKKETVEEDLQMIGMPNALIRRDFTIQVQVSLKNFGKTPAVIERFTVRLSYGRAKPISGAEARIQPNTVIGAGDEIDHPLIVSAPALSKDDAEKIWRGEASLTLGGTLVYRDIWGDKWTVPFDGRNHFDAPVNFGNVGVGFRLDNQPRQKYA